MKTRGIMMKKEVVVVVKSDGCWGMVLTGPGTASPCPTLAPATPAAAPPAPQPPEASIRVPRLPAKSAPLQLL